MVIRKLALCELLLHEVIQKVQVKIKPFCLHLLVCQRHFKNEVFAVIVQLPVMTPEKMVVVGALLYFQVAARSVVIHDLLHVVVVF